MTSTPLLDVANSDGSSETSGNSFTSIESPLNHNGWSRLRERLRSANENEMERPGSASACNPVRSPKGGDLPLAGKKTLAGWILARLQAASPGEAPLRGQWKRAVRNLSLVRNLFAPVGQYHSSSSRSHSFSAAKRRASCQQSSPRPSEKSNRVIPAVEETPEASRITALSVELPEEQSSSPNPSKANDGWRGSRLGNLIDGVYESPEDLQARKRIRLLPEVAQQVQVLWDCADKRVERMSMPGYLDFHLSVFYYISAREGVAKEDVDLMEAWEVSLHRVCPVTP